MDFVEITSDNNWFKKHPNKVAGVEIETTSLHFKYQIKGTREDVENMFSFLYQKPKNKKLRIAKAKAKAFKLKLQLLS